MEENRVIIYSSGIADFLRWYDVKSDQKTSISIPIGTDHLADLLASFNIFGNVKVETPPTFRPSNETEGRLELAPENVLENLSTSLSGSDVKVLSAGDEIQGRLVGLHSEQEGTHGHPSQVKSIVVLTDCGIVCQKLRDVRKLEFLDEGVREEIDKALKRNFQRITPDSTFVELVLSAKGDAEKAAIQYTIPAAAWKISYRLNIQQQKVGLQGYAVVDNNTDEDWKDFRVCVATGQPITFSTDLAESKTPARKRVNLVADSAIGAVEIEEGFGGGAVVMAAPAGAGAEPIDVMAMERSMPRSMKMKKRSPGSVGTSGLSKADVDQAETEEVGDFCFYQSADLVTVAAKRSASIPVFDKDLAEAKSLLHYDITNHPERPFRSIELKNALDHSLGKGVCTVYQDGVFAGSCILPDMKEGQSRLLAHALDSGVKVFKKERNLKRDLLSLQVDAGVGVRKDLVRKKTSYRISNNHKEACLLILDHCFGLSDSKATAKILQGKQSVDQESGGELKNGLRYRLDLPEKTELMFEVEERRVNTSRLDLVRISQNKKKFDTSWIETNVVQTNGTLVDDPQIQNCLAIQKKLSEIESSIAKKWDESGKLEARQNRLRKNIESAGDDGIAKKWREDLGDLEDRIREIEDQQIPEFNLHRDKIEKELHEALMQLSIQWEEAQGS